MTPSPPTTTMVRRPPSLFGVPPRYEVFDRRLSPPMAAGRLYRRAPEGPVVVEVYDDLLREYLKREPPFDGARFEWVLDVAADAAHDTRAAIVRPAPMPAPVPRGAETAPPLDLDAAVEGLARAAFYRVVRTSDPV